SATLGEITVSWFEMLCEGGRGHLRGQGRRFDRDSPPRSEGGRKESHASQAARQHHIAVEVGVKLGTPVHSRCRHRQMPCHHSLPSTSSVVTTPLSEFVNRQFVFFALLGVWRVAASYARARTMIDKAKAVFQNRPHRVQCHHNDDDAAHGFTHRAPPQVTKLKASVRWIFVPTVSNSSAAGTRATAQ